MRRATIPALLLAAAFAAAAGEGATATAAGVPGALPDDPAKPLVQARCLLCHSGDYLTQQRLTEAQWNKTVEKMRKFGSPATDEEARSISAYLAKHWPPELPPPSPLRANPPAIGRRR